MSYRLCFRWLTTGNIRLPHDPYYFCEECFISFNYVDGKKIGEFKAYPFVTCDIDLPEAEPDEEPEAVPGAEPEAEADSQ